MLAGASITEEARAAAERLLAKTRLVATLNRQLDRRRLLNRSTRLGRIVRCSTQPDSLSMPKTEKPVDDLTEDRSRR